jgi:hypothetical protein
MLQRGTLAAGWDFGGGGHPLRSMEYRSGANY